MRWSSVGRRTLLLAGIGIPAALLPAPGSQKDSPAESLASVNGRVRVLEKGNRQAEDVGDAVVWLEPVGHGAAASDRSRPDTVKVVMSKKEFRPHLVVVREGSAVAFPNEDPFTHNVFSLSEVAPFDLGRYDRGAVGTAAFPRAGVVRVFCNVHARMGAVVVVRDNPFYARPAGDGSFTIAGVPPGEYWLHAWHERAREIEPVRLRVGPAGGGGVAVELDARDYKFVQHLNKYGQPYSTARRGRRY